MMTAKSLNTLVPRIRKADFDKEATDFLSEYCPEALQRPMAVPIEDIAAKKLGLRIVEARLSEDFSILGQMCFTTGVAEIYIKESDEYREIEVQAGTMIIDPDVEKMRNIGSRRNTVAHECVHWVKHRDYHLYASLMENASGVAYRCPTVPKDEKQKLAWTDEDWMEWHATGIAPRILMPCETVKIAYAELREKCNRNPFVSAKLRPASQWIVEQLAARFQVSKLSAAIRMKELGYLSS
jgi:hypothetical protein